MAHRVVDPDGRVLWEGEPLPVPGAVPAVICSAEQVAADPGVRRELAARSRAVAVDMESARLAATGRLAGVVRAISDTVEQPVGRLALAARADGGTDWRVVARATAVEPVQTLRTALAARRALAALEHAARTMADGRSAG